MAIYKSEEIATHYGFSIADNKNISFNNSPIYEIDHIPTEKEIIIKNYVDEFGGKKTPPMMLYYNKPVFKKNGNKIVSSRKDSGIGLDIVGVSKSVAEALAIKTSSVILEEVGYKNFYVNINSVGDKDSLKMYNRELNSYMKNHINRIPTKSRKKYENEPLNLLICNEEGCEELREKAPRPINFLSEASQRHFKEIIEYLEAMNIPYRIKDDLVYKDNYYSKIAFEIRNLDSKNGFSDEDTILAKGGRYDEIANRAGNKRNLSAVGVSLEFSKDKNTLIKDKKTSEAKFYLIQFGFEAKLKSLQILEILRRNKIAVKQNLDTDKLTEQMEYIRESNVPYTLIVGQKEALENSVIVRRNEDMSQEYVPIEKLSVYIKKLK